LTRTIKGGQLKVLTQDQIERISNASLEILETLGVKVQEESALQLLAKSGVEVDTKTQVVKVPPSLVKESLRKAPNRILLSGKTPEYDLELEGTNVYTFGGGSLVHVLDLEGRHRLANSKDLEDLTRLQDKLENPHMMHCTVIPSDVPIVGSSLIRYALTTRNTWKHVFADSEGKQGVLDLLKLTRIVTGEEDLTKKHYFTTCSCIVSPLKQNRDSVEVIMEAAKWNVPNILDEMPSPGGTAPVTLAGLLVEQNANILCSLVIAQLVNPGAPCIYGAPSGGMDMRTGNFSGAAPEAGLIAVASAQIAHHYGLPCMTGVGLDSKIPDQQAGYERASNFLMSALGGTNLYVDSTGALETERLCSYEQVAIDNEILQMVYRILRGIEVTDETLALDVIRNVGPLGAHFLSQEHTRRHMRTELWIPDLTDRNTWEGWQRTGGKDIRERANEKVRKILTEHWPKPLSNDVETAIYQEAKEAQNKLLEKR
jgi:trimethylamine--corrinoid protein Co-methyltransferase